MGKEMMIALTEVVESRVTVSVAGKTVLGAFAVTGEEKFALLALPG